MPPPGTSEIQRLAEQAFDELKRLNSFLYRIEQALQRIADELEKARES